MTTILHLVIIFLVGAVSSFINMMAGGGSVLTLGVMMLLGLDAATANGTNRIGVLVATGSGTLTYHSAGRSDLKESFRLALWTLPGAVVGAVFAVHISNALFEKVLAVVMIFIIITLFLPKPGTAAGGAVSPLRRKWIYPAMFFVGLYGGFIQAGVGFFIMAALRHILSLDFTRINQHKIFIVLVYTLPVLLVFDLTRNIDWFYALFLGAGNALGAWLSVKVSLKKGDKAVKLVLAAAIVLMVFKFLF